VTPRVVSINVGAVREVIFRGEIRTTGIWKDPVTGPVAVRTNGVEGDTQADPTVHGGPSKAVYAYAAEDNSWWEQQLGTPVPPGTLGENLTISGVDLNQSVIGEQWRVGGAVLQVTQPRFPCWKLGLRMGDEGFPRRFLAARRPGSYFSVVHEGDVEAGDSLEQIARPAHPVTVGLIARFNHADRELALRLLEATESNPEAGELKRLLTEAGVA